MGLKTQVEAIPNAIDEYEDLVAEDVRNHDAPQRLQVESLKEQVASMRQLVIERCDSMLKDIEKQAKEAPRQQGSSHVPHLTLPGQAPTALFTQAVAPAVPALSSHQAWETDSSPGLDRISSVVPAQDSLVSLNESSPQKNADTKRLSHAARKRITGKKALRVFFDADSLKRQLRENMGKKPYDVADFYWESGCAQFIARSEVFEIVSLVVIAVNSIWLWVDTDLNHAPTFLDAEPVFIVVEITFVVFFLCEWLVRIAAFRNKWSCLEDRWFIFDTFVNTVTILEVVIVPVFVSIIGSSQISLPALNLIRTVRLFRMARMVRLMRAFPEIYVFVKAIIIGFRAVFFSLMLLLVVVYIFAIIFTQLVDGRNKPEGSLAYDGFRTVGKSMSTLLVIGILPDQKDYIDYMGGQSPAFWLLILLYLYIASLTLMNMVIGILCEVISVSSRLEKEDMMLSTVRESLENVIEESGCDLDGDGQITRAEFTALLQHKEGPRELKKMGVDVISMVDLADHFFADSESLTFQDFMQIVLNIREERQASFKDLIHFKRDILKQFAELKEGIGAASLGP